MQIAFATSSSHPTLTADDQLAVSALESRNVRVTPAVWTDRTVAWCEFDLIVVRSTWDYHTRTGEFREWIDRLDALGAPVWNPPALLRWNMEKTYLLALARAGVAVVPMALLSKDAQPDLARVLEERGWYDAVVKPVISATAYRTWRVSRATLANTQSELDELLDNSDAMVQPFLPAIQTEGEWSLMFFDGAFSHAVRKRPRSGDFRVQTEFGGRASPERAPKSVLSAAHRVLAKIREPWLYARVDGVETDAGFQLLELEMLEPSLFLSLGPDAPRRFADAIVRISRERSQ